MENAQTEMWAIDRPVPYENNPRVNTEAISGVARSIEQFGFLIPIVVDKNEVVVAGHTRIEAARSLGIEEVPVIQADHLTEEQATAFRLAENRLHENARWDDTKLSGELALLQEMGFDLEETGFTVDEIDCLIDPINADCLDDLSHGVVCGDVEERESAPATLVNITVGYTKRMIPLAPYTQWEKGMLIEYGSHAGMMDAVLDRLGLGDLIRAEEEAAGDSDDGEE